MSNLVLPSPQPPNWNITWPIKKAPQYSTLIQTPASGIGELRIPLYLFPRWVFELDLSYIKSDFSVPSSALQQIAGFYMSVSGRADDWLYLDPYDNSVSGAAFGVGDGSTLTFQLTRPIGSGSALGSDIIQNLNGTPTVYVDGTPDANVSIGSTGIVTFASPPSNGAVLTWSGSFYFRCRFTDDVLQELQEELYQIWSLRKLRFITVILSSSEYTSPQQTVIGSSTLFQDDETPTGTIDGSNKVFTLSKVPNPSSSLLWVEAGITLSEGVDYTIAGNTVTRLTAPAAGPIRCWYRYTEGTNFADNETPTGTIDGSNTSFTLANTPSPPGSLIWAEAGITLTEGLDYTIASNVVTRLAAPTTGPIRCWYRY